MGDDVILNKATTLLTHTGTTGLKITSTQAAAYVEVEDIRFTALKMGVGLTDVITLATTGVHVTGTLQTTGLATLASASVTGALSSGAATLASATLNGDLTTSGDIAMSKTASAITHTAAAGATSGLTISSDNGFVEVESVRITGGASKSDIGFGATAVIALSATGMGVTGTVSSTGDLTVGSSKFVVTASSGDLAQTGDTSLSKTAAAITHTAAAGATSGLTISSDNGFVEVESVRITGGASKSDIVVRCDGYHRAVCVGRGRDRDGVVDG